MTMALAAFAPANVGEAMELSKLLAGSALLPDGLRQRPQDVLVTLITGHELGLSPMQAIRGLHVIKGKAVMSADLQVALVKRHPECVRFRLVESTDQRATYETERRGEGPTRMSFTIDQARQAGLTGDNWRKYPAAMLRARASSALARVVYPDLTMGVYDPDEARDFGGGDAPPPPPVERDVTPPAQPTQSRTAEVKARLAERTTTPPPGRATTPEDAARATRAHRIWEKAKAGGATPDAFKMFVGDLLGGPKPSSQWSDADMDLISEALEVGDAEPNEPPPPTDADAPPPEREPGEDDGDEVDMSLTVRVKGQDVLISSLEPKSLAWWSKKLREDVADPGKARWSASNAAKLRTVEALLST